MASYRLGVDVGGTNTDLVLHDESSGRQLVEKLPSTPSNPAAAVLEGIHRFVAAWRIPRRDRFFRARYDDNHQRAAWSSKASTLGYLLPRATPVSSTCRRRRAPATCSTTRSSARNPLVSREFIREIPGRVDRRGVEVTPFDSAAVRAGAEQLAKQGIRSFAICYIFSFMNPAHERATAEIIRSVVPDATISMSSSVMPRIREWPRFSTTMLNAYLEPILVRYIDDLSKGLDELGVQSAQRFLMQSNGGVMPFSGVCCGRQYRTHAAVRPRRRRAGLVSSAERDRAVREPDHDGYRGNFLRHRLYRGRRGARDRAMQYRRPAYRRAEPRYHDDPGGWGHNRAGRPRRIPGRRAGKRRSRAGAGMFWPRRHSPDDNGRLYRVRSVERRQFSWRRPENRRCCGASCDRDASGQSRLGFSVVQAASGILRIVNARIADEIQLQAAKKGIELSEVHARRVRRSGARARCGGGRGTWHIERSWFPFRREHSPPSAFCVPMSSTIFVRSDLSRARTPHAESCRAAFRGR